MDKFLDFLYDTIDEQARLGNFDNIDSLLEIVRDDIDLNIALGILTASLPMKHKLKNRTRYYCKLTKWISPEILEGLE